MRRGECVLPTASASSKERLVERGPQRSLRARGVRLGLLRVRHIATLLRRRRVMKLLGGMGLGVMGMVGQVLMMNMLPLMRRRR